jgi:hypothetical protein
MHPIAWKGNSPKSVCTVLHSLGRMGGRGSPQRHDAYKAAQHVGTVDGYAERLPAVLVPSFAKRVLCVSVVDRFTAPGSRRSSTQFRWRDVQQMCNRSGRMNQMTPGEYRDALCALFIGTAWTD